MQNETAYKLINLAIRKLIENALTDQIVNLKKGVASQSVTKNPVYLTTKELMKQLKLSPSTMVRYRKRGMPYFKGKDRKGIRYDFDKVLKWMGDKA